jgi:hypothetical protein
LGDGSLTLCLLGLTLEMGELSRLFLVCLLLSCADKSVPVLLFLPDFMATISVSILEKVTKHLNQFWEGISLIVLHFKIPERSGALFLTYII